MYKATDKICDLMSHEEEAIQIISRFGLGMGVGEQTIAQTCEAYGVHTATFLAIINFKVFKQRAIITEIDIPTLQRYLRNAHTYFLDFRLPFLRRALIEAIIPADPTSKIPMLILRCYDEFVEEIRAHIEHENAGLFEEHTHDPPFKHINKLNGNIFQLYFMLQKLLPLQANPRRQQHPIKPG